MEVSSLAHRALTGAGAVPQCAVLVLPLPLSLFRDGGRSLPRASSMQPSMTRGLLLHAARRNTGRLTATERHTGAVPLQAVVRQAGAPSQELRDEEEQQQCGEAPVSEGGREDSAGEVYDKVKDYYGKQVTKQSELQTSACLLPGLGSDTAVKNALRHVHAEVLEKFYGCGSPIPPMLQGLTTLDLGCGSGRDVYVMAQLVGPTGTVIGIDMTDEQLSVARKHEDWHRQQFGFPAANTSFRQAHIEDLKQAGVEDGSIDVVTSNCVVNLSPDKRKVLREVARVLKTGGELYFSDIFADRRIPMHLQKDKVLLGECLSGAMYVDDFRRMMAEVGLSAWGICDARTIAIEKRRIREQLGDVRFYSLTIRAVRLPAAQLDDLPEDYGQVATYNGSIPGSFDTFELDEVRRFPAFTPVPVDATTAAMLESSRYSAAFAVTQGGEHHRGVFTRWAHPPASVAGAWRQAKGVDEKAVKTSCC